MADDDPIGALENTLRDLVQRLLQARYGDAWVDHLGVTPKRLEAWKERREAEAKKRPGMVVDDRILYYSDFYDLRTIVKKNWDVGFKDCFDDWKELEVDLKRLEGYRNPQAHSRSLRPFERSLAEGICGLRRNEVTIYLSQGQGNEREYFARIEEVTDSFGHRWVGRASSIGMALGIYKVDIVLHPGDSVAFQGRAWDPDEAPLRWAVRCGLRSETESEGHETRFSWDVTDQDIGETTIVSVKVSSSRPYSRSGGPDGNDDELSVIYRVLPR